MTISTTEVKGKEIKKGTYLKVKQENNYFHCGG